MNEIKRIGTNVLFWVGTVLLAMLFLASGAPYIETLLRTQYCAEGIGWVEGFRYCTTNEMDCCFCQSAYRLPQVRVRKQNCEPDTHCFIAAGQERNSII